MFALQLFVVIHELLSDPDRYLGLSLSSITVLVLVGGAFALLVTLTQKLLSREQDRR